MPEIGRKSTYYERHRAERLQYQSQYYKIKNNGRRKAGKAAREAAAERRRGEIHGERHTYYCSFVHKTAGHHPARTEEMRTAEENMWDRCFGLMSDLKQQEGPDWPSSFVTTLDVWIEEQIVKAQQVIAAVSLIDWSVELHGLRRLVAGLVQQQEMAVQSPEAQYAVGEDFTFAWLGRRVNKVAFRAVYGW
ncbi:hypothetical protein BV25DRAFT_1922346 [Artomyces pyxidatus]|uniref:Uncharacterized protein n=1 Tax=Artomyces pyxidatus TaxID=48021 RepID=A0ACB8SEA1_9AGAM|nr:hypothetical protein BV25DRAFT_1922346 [Artomyces pyxidatus]